MSILHKIYKIHNELSFTERTINATLKHLDDMANKNISYKDASRYHLLNDILNACIKARSDLQHELQEIHYETIRKNHN